MKLFHWLLPGLVCCSLLGCTDDEPDSTPYVPSGPEFKPLGIEAKVDSVHPALGITISIQRTTDSDSARTYKLISSYDGNPVGLTMVIPRKDIDKPTGSHGYFKTLGAPSDLLLQVLAKEYRQRVDSVEKFGDSIPFDCINLNDISPKTDYWAPSSYKLVFHSPSDSDGAQLLMNLHPADQFVEFLEKDTVYRLPVINAFTQH